MADLNDIKLSSDNILKKQFRTKVKGYDPDEVDAYLDQIISDYDTFESIVEDLYGQIGKLQRELMDANQKLKTAANTAKPIVSATTNQADEVKTYQPSQQQNDVQTESSAPKTESSTNMAIIQRISTLERKVYNLEQRVYGLQK
jgi:DivIVA domain-containing protein